MSIDNKGNLNVTFLVQNSDGLYWLNVLNFGGGKEQLLMNTLM